PKPRIDPAVGRFQNRLEQGRVGQDQSLNLVLQAEEDGDRTAVARDDHRSVLALLQVRAEPRLHVRDGSDPHGSASSLQVSVTARRASWAGRTPARVSQ